MQRSKLVSQIQEKKNYLCVGLDTDTEKLPIHLRNKPDGIFEFNKRIIDATLEHCVSYKINTAFYESMGAKGWEIMQETFNYIPDTHFKIADAKRGDIGNTSHQYAIAFYETLKADAVTVAPYMGEDSIKPFLSYKDKWAIVLGLTSNAGSKDFQQLLLSETGKPLYETVLETVAKWGSADNTMFVTGATKADYFEDIRRVVPEHFLLVPGVGAQGGSLSEVSKKGANKEIGLLINASRAIIYAGSGEDFDVEAAVAAKQICTEMEAYIV